jgi:hypothetical protein
LPTAPGYRHEPHIPVPSTMIEFRLTTVGRGKAV